MLQPPPVPENRFYDALALILETRFLLGAVSAKRKVVRPLEDFGLAEVQRVPHGPDEVTARFADRKSPLFDRVLTFQTASGA